MTTQSQVRSSLQRVSRGARLLEIAARAVEGESVQVRAMALTYISLFAMVPGLVVAFSVVQAFTGMARIAVRVHDFVFENLAVGAQATIQPYLEKFIQNAQATSAGLVGAVLLVWSSVSLFRHVEGAINDVWGIRKRRTLRQAAVLYWVGLTLGPILLAASVSVSAAAKAYLASAGLKVLANGAAVLLTTLFFGTLYLLVPNTKVRLGPAASAGFAAAVVWEAAKWAYALLIGTAIRYNAVYGSVAAVPVFILWLFVSWSIVLFGARLAYVIQYAAVVINGKPAERSEFEREVLANRVLLAVARAFDAGQPAPDALAISTQLGLHGDEVIDALSRLRGAGLVASLADNGAVPARPLEKLTLLDVRRAALGKEPPAGHENVLVASILKQVDDQAAERLDEVTFRELIDRELPDSPERAVAPISPASEGNPAPSKAAGA
ncbi:MAG: YhjD/YihY/BrkB family envelope integrity protein [Anaeromyxobacter sp.]